MDRRFNCIICGFDDIEARRLFCFPRNPENVKLWLESMKMSPFTCVNDSFRRSHRICDRHFTPDCFQNSFSLRLNRNAIPSLYPATHRHTYDESSSVPETTSLSLNPAQQVQKMHHKRPYVEESTLSPTAKQVTKTFKENDSTAIQQSYSQAHSPIKMAIVLQTYPKGKLTPEQAKQIQQALEKEIFRCEPGTGPQFTGSYERAGVLFVSCLNSDSQNWLQQKLCELPLWEGASLRIGQAKDVLKTSKVVVWIPTDLLEVKNPSEILPLLQIQNKDLQTSEWRIVSSCIETQGITIVFAIDEKSLQDLNKAGFKAYLGLSQITFTTSKV